MTEYQAAKAAFAIFFLAIAILMVGLFFMEQFADEVTEYYDDGCLVEVHKNNHLFDKDTVKITRYCS